MLTDDLVLSPRSSRSESEAPWLLLHENQYQRMSRRDRVRDRLGRAPMKRKRLLQLVDYRGSDRPRQAVAIAIALLSLALAAGAQPTLADELHTIRGSVLRVGVGCTYSTIQAAIDSVPADGSAVIRIRDDFFNENLVIENKSLDLIGGHDSCSDTSPDSATTISGISINSPTLTVQNDRMFSEPDSEINVFLVNLDLQDGSVGTNQRGGGLRVVSAHGSGRSARTNVTLNNTWVINNQAGSGGGVALWNSGPGGDGGQFAMIGNSRISSNQAVDTVARGGGLYCLGNFSLLLQGGEISDNTAGMDGGVSALGGGMYVQGCEVDWFAQGAGEGSGSLDNNTVHGRGGGLYATGAATVDLIGAHFSLFVSISTRPFRLHDNSASGSNGGGIYAGGAGTQVTVDRGWIYDNDALAQGGGLFAGDGAVIRVQRREETCHDRRRCSQIFGNRTGAGGGGAGFAVNPGSRITLSRTRIFDNTAGLSSAPAALVAAPNGLIRMEDSILYGPAGPSYALYTNEGVLQIVRSTIADTGAGDAVFFLQGDTARLSLFDSIVSDAAPLPIVEAGTGSPIATMDCNLWHDDGLAAFGTPSRSLIADPRFVDRASNRYDLEPDSPAVNYCSVAPPAPGVDLEWRPRGLVQPEQPVRYGPFDLGALETSYGLFSDRFETP